MARRAHFLNVGCADCTIFEIDEFVIIIDCGYRRLGSNISKPVSILDYLKYEIGKNHIDLMIVSHPHHDHYLGLEELVGKIKVREFWGSPYKRRTSDNSISVEEWNEYINVKERICSDRYVCTKGAEKSFFGYRFLILGPSENVNDDDSRECHDACLVVWVSTPYNNFIVCGDASDALLDNIRLDWKLASCNILRCSHHGSINGANLEFIKNIQPETTIISTKSGIFDNLPHDDALARYRNNSKNVLRTDISGTLTCDI